MEFKQKLTPQDLVEYNVFLLNQKKLLKINTKIIGLIALGFFVYSIFEKNVLGAILLALAFIYSFFFFFPVLNYFIKRKTLKGIKHKELIIRVKVDDEGINYALESEPEVPTYNWNSIEKAYSTEGYIYVRINYYSHLIIKKEYVPSIEELDDLFKSKLIENVRYKIKRVH